MRRTDIKYKRRSDINKTHYSSCILVSTLFCFVFFLGVTFYLHFHVSEHDGSLNDASAFPFIFKKLQKFENDAMKEVLDFENRAVNALKNIIGFDSYLHFTAQAPLPKPSLTTSSSALAVAQSESAASLETEKGSSSEFLALQKPNINPNLERISGHRPDCPHVEYVTFWKDPLVSDVNFLSPFASVGPNEKYVSFEPDVGGWNNIRMQMETVLVMAIATGRTLVLPPDQPLYLLNKGKGHENHHSFADFFPFEEIRKRLPVISMKEFLEKEAITGHLYKQILVDGYEEDKGPAIGPPAKGQDPKPLYPPGNKVDFDGTNNADSSNWREYLRAVGVCPKWKGNKEYLVIPPGPGIDVLKFLNATNYIERRKLASDLTIKKPRLPVIYDEYWQNQKLIHIISKPGTGYRLLQHFYSFIHFDDEKMGNLYKRFVRDYVHYIDIIFCKAAMIVESLMKESNGTYTAFHVRRGEFQYKPVKIPAEEILKNVGHLLPSNGLVFIATDEKNKDFFRAFKQKFHKIRYLDDYVKIAGLDGINPNFLGMIDQVVCTRASLFVGTWFSTFTGYITRMRGYHGYDDHTVWYADLPHRDRFQKHELPMFPYYMREWNVSWYKIDEQSVL